MVREYGVGPLKVELGQPVCPSSAPRCCPRRREANRLGRAQSFRARAVDGHKPGRAPPDHFYQSSELVYKGQNALAGCFCPRRPPLDELQAGVLNRIKHEEYLPQMDHKTMMSIFKLLPKTMSMNTQIERTKAARLIQAKACW